MAVPMLFNAVALLPELTPIANVNDDAAHELFVRRADEAIAEGQDAVDFWVPDLELGFPQFAYYQHLPYLGVVAIDRALLGRVDIVSVFNGVRYGLMVGFPVTVLWAMRRMGFSPTAASIGAAASALLSSDGLLGLDYDSYVWRGYGVFTQLVAAHLFFIVLALLQRVLDRGRGHVAATAAVAALVLSHLLYAFMMVVTAGVIAVAASWRAIPLRLVRLAGVGLGAAVLSAYLLVPAALTSYFLNASPYLESYKYDSFGAAPILGWLVGGRLLDAGRFPVLTVLLGSGIVAALVTRARPALLALGLFLTWLVLYFGRPTLGGAIDLIPFHQVLFFHRFIGGVHVAAILLAGAGGAWLWELAQPWRHRARLAAVVAAAALVLVPALQERAAYYGLNAQWIERTQTAIAGDADARAIFETLAALPAGRVYAGQRTDWSEELDFGIPFRSVRLYDLLAFREIASFAVPYQGPSLNSDLVFAFDPANAGEYAALGVTYVIAPTTRAMPAFLSVVRRTPLYTLYAAKASATAHYAAISDTIRVARQADLLPVMRAWLTGPGPSAGQAVRLEFPAGPPGPTGATLPGCPSEGSVTDERVAPGRLSFIASCPAAATLVITATYHPNWQVTSDGEPLPTFMVSPSVIGVSLPPGSHRIVAEYRSTPMKAPLLVLGGVALAALIVLRRRIERLDARVAARWIGR